MIVPSSLNSIMALALFVHHRIVGCKNPDFLAALADPLVLGGLVFAAVESCPELAIGRAVALGRADEHAVALALDFVKGVAERVQEVFVGSNDSSVKIEFDDGLRATHRGRLRRIVQVLQTNAGVGPFDCDAGAASIGLLQGRRHEIEGPLTDLDRCAVHGTERLKHLPLMARVLVERVDISSDQGVDIEFRQIPLQVRLGLPQQRLHRLIHVDDVEILVRHHHLCSEGLSSKQGQGVRTPFTAEHYIDSNCGLLRQRCIANSRPIAGPGEISRSGIAIPPVAGIAVAWHASRRAPTVI